MIDQDKLLEERDDLIDTLYDIKHILENECPHVLSQDSEEAHTLDEKVDEILDEINWVLR